MKLFSFRRAPWIKAALPSVLSVLASLLACGVAIALTKGSLFTAVEAYGEMLWGGLGDLPALLDGAGAVVITRPLGESATKASILLLTGLSVAVGFRVGLFNIGAQGQLMVGGLLAALLGTAALPAGLHPLACLLLAAMGGGLYALIPTALKLRRGVHEVISTIMLNWVAVALIENWLVVGPLQAKSEEGLSMSGTPEILPTAHLPRLLGDLSRLNAGVLLALGAALAIYFWLSYSVSGFETTAVGHNPDAAQAAGIPTQRRTYQAMALSGALAGLAGAVLILGSEFKYPGRLGAPYGFDGIAISLIGQNHPLGVMASAALFGVLRAGGTRMQLLGVHKSFPELIQGLALLLVAARWGWLKLISARRRVEVSGA